MNTKNAPNLYVKLPFLAKNKALQLTIEDFLTPQGMDFKFFMAIIKVYLKVFRPSDD